MNPTNSHQCVAEEKTEQQDPLYQISLAFYNLVAEPIFWVYRSNIFKFSIYISGISAKAQKNESPDRVVRVDADDIIKKKVTDEISNILTSKGYLPSRETIVDISKCESSSASPAKDVRNDIITSVIPQTSETTGAQKSITTNTFRDDDDEDSNGSGEVQTDLSDWKIKTIPTTVLQLQTIESGAQKSITINTFRDDDDEDLDGSGEVQTDLSDWKIKTIPTTVLQKQTIETETCTPLVPLVFAVIGWILAVGLAGTTVFYKRQLHTKKSNTPVASSANYLDMSGARELTNYSAIDIQASNEHNEDINEKI
ncbi:unnamed protein product [Mytilus coruscus]|uniref:Uncharacterized protein n=1 Tax=Mytilus coruscus TaxID=42192 RepID=A0A6J8E251_MYTCO|nr:unnamed protein product [Mytilus coruscus]